MLVMVWSSPSSLEPTERNGIKCHCIECGVVYLGDRGRKSSPLRVLLTPDGLDGGEWLWLIPARAETSSMLQPRQS